MSILYDAIANAYMALKSPKSEPLTEGYLAEEMLSESRIDWLKKNYSDISFAHDPSGPAKTPHELIDKIATEGDPTKNKVHTQWLTNLYKAGAFKQEDLYKAHAALTDYEGVSSAEGEKRKGAKHMMSPDERQINHTKYPTISSLQQAVAKHGAGGIPTSVISGKIKEHEEAGKSGHTQVWDDEHTRIYRLENSPEGKHASISIYGGEGKDGGSKNGGTDWCTASKNPDHNYFESYMNDHPGSHYYVVHRKSDGAVFQYHTHSDQFKDKHDDEINHDDLKTIQPSLHAAWKAKPDLLD